MRNVNRSSLFALVAFVALGAAAFGEGVIPPRITPPVPHVTTAPAAPAAAHTVAPTEPAAPLGTGQASTLGNVRVGERVPLSRLAPLPRQTKANTVTATMARNRIRPLSANGATEIIGGNCTGAIGDQFVVGCTITWTPSFTTTGADNLEDYVVAPTNGNENTTSATDVRNYKFANGLNAESQLLAAGTYIFGTYDSTAGQWIAVIYVNAGQVFGITVYQDAFHTQETYQFDAATSSNAYIYLQNVSASDYFVVGISQTAVAPNCVFMAPAPLPYPYTYPANQLCDLALSTGAQATGGNLAVTWPISSTLNAGTYSVEVYDLTLGERLGQVQVSLTGGSGLILSTKTDATDATVSNPSPGPSTAYPATIFDWDQGPNSGAGDQSDSGFTASLTGVAPNAADYEWTINDPQGQVISAAPYTVAGNAASNTFDFTALTGGAATMLSPGSYPAKSFTVTLENTVTKSVVASQGFEVLGYASLTQFNNSGTLGSSVSIAPAGSTVAGMEFTNDSSAIYNNMGDNLSEIEFTTGNDFTNSATTGNGIMASSVNGATVPCIACATTTTTDSVGNQWNVNVTCSGATATANGECDILLTPVVSNDYLAPGADIPLSNITFFYATGANCGNVCYGLTRELPQHGLNWSNTGSQVSSTEVSFRDNAASASATAIFRMAGSLNLNNRNAVGTLPPTSDEAFVGTHYFVSPFAQTDYDTTSPYTITVSGNANASYDDILAFTITNTGATAIKEVAIGSPPQLLFQGYAGVDTTLNGNWNPVGCPGTIPSNFVCFTPTTTIGTAGASKTQTLYLDQSMSLQSIPATDFQIEGETNGTNEWFGIGPASNATLANETTPDGLHLFDNLGFGLYSLLAQDMTVAFNPASIGTGTTADLSVTVTNTSNAVDPNPDSVDIVVLEAPNQTLTVTGSPTVTNAGWSYLGAFKKGATKTQYWFGLCAAQATGEPGTYAGPPAANSSGYAIPLSAKYPAITSCGAGPEADSAQAGQTVTINSFKLSGFAAGTESWNMYAHGANSGGWSAAQPFTLTINNASANAGFSQLNGTPVTNGTTPSIGTSPNTYQYAISNTSSATNITTAVITLPGLDINNENADSAGSGGPWTVSALPTLTFPGGQGDGSGGCTVTYTNPTAAGANGNITLSGCTAFKPNDTIYVNFSASNPEVESDGYLFPTTVNGTAAGPTWLGDQQINEAFSIGLDIVTDPGNDGVTNLSPTCVTACNFSGSTIDFGNIANSSSNSGTDLVRASVYYTGATSVGKTMTLSIEASQNPVNSTGTPTNELQTEIDYPKSSGNFTGNQESYAVIPIASELLLATVPETQNTKPYDVPMNFSINIGTEAIEKYVVTLTYTLVPQ